jgi:probable HAF family extracellular repeat protein
MLAVWIGLCSASPLINAQTYRAINLGQLASTKQYFYATALNNSNQVVGYTVPGTLYVKPVLWHNGVVTDLGSLTGADGAAAFGINDAGEIVGSSPSASGSSVPVSWTNGTLANLGTFGGIQGSTAYGVNSTGQIVGTSSVPYAGPASPVNTTAFIWSGGTMTALYPSTDTDSYAYAINDAGNAVGTLKSLLACSCPLQAVLFAGGTTTILPQLQFPGGVSSTSSSASAMNNHLQIAGSVATSVTGTPVAVVWSSAGGAPTVTELGVGQALGINNAGQIVGISSAGHAILWPTVGATGLDLNNLIDPATPLNSPVPLVLMRANAINDNGAIIAIASPDGGTTIESILLEPETLSLSVTPAALNFAAQSVGTTGAAQTVTVANTGATAFNLSGIVVSGDYTQTNNCGASVSAGAHCAIAVKFAPTVPGTRTGVLTVASGGTSYSADLTGTGKISVTLSASASTAAAGTPVTLTWKAPGTRCAATGGSAGDGWMGNLPASGSAPVTEKAVGTQTYLITCSAAGQTASAQVSVSVGLPTVSLSAAPTMLAFGQATTLSWTSTFATTCSATGGAHGDAWAGAKAISGRTSVTESASGSYSYTLTCGTGSVTAKMMAVVTVNAIPSSGMGGGGGAMDPCSVLCLLAMMGLSGRPRLRQRLRATTTL